MEERLNNLLVLALKYRASDIHIMKYKNEVNIEMRIGDKLYKVKTEVQDLKLIRYLQYLANLDVANLLKPQTGQFEKEVLGKHLSLRFALIHDNHMDNGVLRILNDDVKINHNYISIYKSQNDFFKNIMKNKTGLFIVSGVTSSGKTTLLYTLLSKVNNKKIFTIEDPVEIRNENYIQIEVNESIGLGYDEAIRQVLRHDPDIIMISEIRDEISAKMAIRAANTGHFVLATLHSGSCIGAINRLLELGVNKSQLQNNLIAVTNQRLFDKANSKDKITCFEIMDQEELDYYFRFNENSPNFIKLKDRIEDTCRNGFIKKEEIYQ